MKLHEYQSKRIFAQYGVPIPRGDVAATPEQARQIAARLGKQVVVKSQVLVGGRGKAGGIRLADDPDEAEQVAAQILGMDIKGLTVHKVLVSECATSTARDPGLALRADRTSSGSALLSQSWATRRTVRPYRSPNPAHISPNRPLQTATRVSPGRKKLTTAPSMAARPVPWIGRMSAEAVPKRGRAPSMSSERAKENSGVRWWRTR